MRQDGFNGLRGCRGPRSPANVNNIMRDLCFQSKRPLIELTTDAIHGFGFTYFSLKTGILTQECIRKFAVKLAPPSDCF